ncbi:MAG: trypsin-like peptidase domain-containing protein [Chloroflexi bacterium]|nr:trypsin-like peptidase domain-containing protein [Chloroflexota bacterium]MBU1660377.1 trypsin-like peptidase domain-containing protein [Chloroflexota bacterium]
MAHGIDASTLRVLDSNSLTVGTGFLVAPNLVVTCAHVVGLVDAVTGDTIQVQFTGQSEKIAAVVLPEFWSEPDKLDIAILKLEKVPAGIHPLWMERATTCRLNASLYTFGYASAAGEDKLSGYGGFRNFPEGSKVFQFRMHEADHGHSGAPVLDVSRGVVIGMVQKGEKEPGRNDETTFAIPTEAIWQVCPQLKPPTPILPRRNPIVEGINLLPYDYNQRIQNFLKEYLGDEKNPVLFGGRDKALHTLDNWLDGTTPNLLLAAPAGRGKSALLVRWLDSLSAREDLALAFVPAERLLGVSELRPLLEFVYRVQVHPVKDNFRRARPVVACPAADDGIEFFDERGLRATPILTHDVFDLLRVALLRFSAGLDDSFEARLSPEGAGVVLAHTVGYDLALDNLTVLPTNPASGQPVTLTAVLRNAGDLTFAAPQVDFTEQGLPITDTLTLPNLRSGESFTATIRWTLPITAEVRTFGATADPLGGVAETEEGNNRFEVVTSLPDLSIHAASAVLNGERAAFSVWLANAGVLDVISDFSLAFLAGDPITGTLVTSLPLDVTVPAGGRIQITGEIDDLSAFVGSGGTLWVVADAGDAVLEADETNNAAPTGLRPLTDLTISPSDVQVQGSAIAITIHNRGIVTATDVYIVATDGALDGTVVFSGTLPLVPPGGSTTRVFSPGLGAYHLFVKVDPDNALTETNEGNNLAIREVVLTSKVFLPIVMR